MILLTLTIDFFPWFLATALPLLVAQKAVCSTDVFVPETAPSSWLLYRTDVCSAVWNPPTWLVCFLVVEAVFHCLLKIKIRYLQSIDPLESSLQAAPVMGLDERRLLFTRVLEAEKKDLKSHYEHWLFGTDLRDVSVHDLENLLACRILMEETKNIFRIKNVNNSTSLSHLRWPE